MSLKHTNKTYQINILLKHTKLFKKYFKDPKRIKSSIYDTA